MSRLGTIMCGNDRSCLMMIDIFCMQPAKDSQKITQPSAEILSSPYMCQVYSAKKTMQLLCR